MGPLLSAFCLIFRIHSRNGLRHKLSVGVFILSFDRFTSISTNTHTWGNNIIAITSLTCLVIFGGEGKGVVERRAFLHHGLVFLLGLDLAGDLAVLALEVDWERPHAFPRQRGTINAGAGFEPFGGSGLDLEVERLKVS